MFFVFAAAVSIPLGLDLYRPAPQNNPITKEGVSLGRKLFFDKRLSRDGTVACATCHNPAKAFTDGRTVAEGVGDQKGNRNAPTLVNRAWGRVFFMDGRAPTLEKQAIEPILNPIEMDLTLRQIKERVGLEPEQVTRALASYVRTILSGNSPYDKYVNGDRAALSAKAQAGLAVFRGKGHCTSCHAGPTLTDEAMHNTGVAWRDGRLVDPGAGEGRFKVPTLREVARTAPYMHDGSMAALEDVVEFYDRGGNLNPYLDEEIRPLKLTSEEKNELVEFLRSLSGRISEGRL